MAKNIAGYLSGYSVAWPTRMVWDHENAGSNPAIQTIKEKTLTDNDSALAKQQSDPAIKDILKNLSDSLRDKYGTIDDQDE